MSDVTPTSERSAEPASFTIERIYPTSPRRVFAAWSQIQAKRSWFAQGNDYSLDFTLGGVERLEAQASERERYIYEARYYDIVTDERIVYVYEMYRNGTRISVSLTSVELEAVAEGTRLSYIEQGVFLDGQDTSAAREHGTRELLEKLSAQLSETEAGA
jgi:uncharacterized protein YndB with AHSA1/START domain